MSARGSLVSVLDVPFSRDEGKQFDKESCRRRSQLAFFVTGPLGYRCDGDTKEREYRAAEVDDDTLGTLLK